MLKSIQIYSQFLNIFSYFTPLAFSIIRSFLGDWIHEIMPMIRSLILIVRMFFWSLVAYPAIYNICCSWCYLFFYHCYKYFCCSIRNLYKKKYFFLLGSMLPKTHWPSMKRPYGVCDGQTLPHQFPPFFHILLSLSGVLC